MTTFWRETSDGVLIAVRLTPRGGRDALDGAETLADGRTILKARVRAAPSEGEANVALIELLASVLDLPRSRLTLVSGGTNRIKTIAAIGDTTDLVGRLQTLQPGRA